MNKPSRKIEAELNQAKIIYNRKVKERDECKKKLEAIEAEVAELLTVKWGGERVGNIPQLEKELHTARGREYRETLPAPVLTIQPSWEPKANFLIEKVTSKRIYLTTIVGNDFYVSRDGSDSWSRTWGLDIPATIAVWQNFLANNSPTRKPD